VTLTDVILALLHGVVTPRNRRRYHHGGWRHRRSVLTPAPPKQSPPLAAPHCRVLERPPSPSPDWPAYRPMEPSDPDTSPWGCRGRSCAIHGWGCPNRVAPVQGPLSSSRQGEEERSEEEEDECRIIVITGPVGAPVIRCTAHISIGPRGRLQGPLAPQTETPTTSTSPTLAAPPVLPSPKAGSSGFGTLS
jgi:hypothetical protein